MRLDLNPIIFGWSLVFLGFMWGPLLIKNKMKREQLTFLRHEQHLAYFILIHGSPSLLLLEEACSAARSLDSTAQSEYVRMARCAGPLNHAGVGAAHATPGRHELRASDAAHSGSPRARAT